MTKRILITSTGALFAAMFASNAQSPKAAEAVPSCVTTLGVDVASAYVFRGATLFDKPVAQPYISANIACGLTFGAWSNIALDDSKTYGGEAGKISEVDLSVEYALPLGKSPIGASAVYTQYTYPNTVTGEGTIEDPTESAEDDSEIGLKLALQTDCALDQAINPTLAVFYGLDGAIDKAMYVELGVGHDVELNKDLAFGLGGTLGYANGFDASGSEVGLQGGDGLSSATLSAKLKASCGGAIGVTYVFETDDDVLAVDEEVLATLSLSKSF